MCKKFVRCVMSDVPANPIGHIEEASLTMNTPSDSFSPSCIVSSLLMAEKKVGENEVKNMTPRSGYYALGVKEIQKKGSGKEIHSRAHHIYMKNNLGRLFRRMILEDKR